MSTIADRLRERARTAHSGRVQDWSILEDAAREIDRLTTENTALRADNDEWWRIASGRAADDAADTL